jgi:EREBP-like factor
MQEQAWPLDAQQSRSSDASAPVGILVSIHLIENLIRRLQGQRNSAQIKLPMDVTVEVKDVRIGRVVKRVVHMRNFTSKLFQLQRSSSSLVDVQFQEPLLSKIKSCPGNSRHWSVNESVTPPCLVLELWGNNEGEALDREDKQEEQQPVHRPVRQYVQQQPVQYVEQRPLQPLHQPPPHQELRAEKDTRPSGRDQSNIHMTMKLVKSFFGDSVELPLQIVVDVPVEGMTQTAYLRAKGAKQAILCIEEPLRTKICSSQGRHRRWTLCDTLLNGLPCITLEMGATEGNSSKYVGANERWGKWRTVIKIHNKDYYLGTYITEEESARVYDSACYYLRGPKAKLNFPNEARQPLPDDLRAKINAALSSVGNSKKAMAAASNAGLADAGWEMGDDDDMEEDEDDDDDGEDARHPLECQVSTVGHPLALSAPNSFSPDHYYPPYNLPSSSLGAGSMGSFNINPAYNLSLSQMPPVAEVKQGVPLNDGTFGFGSFAFENAEEGSVPTKNDKNNYIFISMIIIKSFFGDLVELPFKVRGSSLINSLILMTNDWH